MEIQIYCDFFEQKRASVSLLLDCFASQIKRYVSLVDDKAAMQRLYGPVVIVMYYGCKLSSCSAESVSGCFITIQVVPSVHGGVVSEPLKRQYVLSAGSKAFISIP